MGHCFTVQQAEPRIGSRLEKEFEPMMKLDTINSKEDMKIGKSDFVVEHRKSKLMQYYNLEASKILGQGSFGMVQQCVHKATGEKRAVKRLNLDKMSATQKVRLEYEIDILKNLNHPNILKLYETFEEKKHIYLVTEYCEGGELFDEIIQRQRFEERDAAVIIKQLLSSIAYCHSKKVCHRDLKPENILIDNKETLQIKLIDFGTSQRFEDVEKMELVLGTAYYIAPEVLKGQYNEKCDIWSIGVILYILLSGEPPFPGSDDKEILRNVIQGKYGFTRSVWNSRSEQAKDFIKLLMNYLPDKRPTAAECLNHPWLLKKTDDPVDESVAQNALRTLRRFRTDQKLQQAALTYIVCQLLPKEENDRLKASFQALDRNSDGKITKEELTNGFRKIYGHLKEADLLKEIDRAFARADLDGDGYIDFSEWQICCVNKEQIMQKERLIEAFKLFDKDGNGKISAKEVKRVLGSGGKKYGNDNIWKQIIKEVDEDGDGFITFQEFQKMMNQFLRASEMIDRISYQPTHSSKPSSKFESGPLLLKPSVTADFSQENAESRKSEDYPSMIREVGDTKQESSEEIPRYDSYNPSESAQNDQQQ